MINNSIIDELYDNKSLCKRLGVSLRTLQLWRDSQAIRYFQKGRKIMYLESWVLEFLEKHSKPTFKKLK